MVAKPVTRDVDKTYYINFLKRADECYNAAKNSYVNGEWNASAINSIHSCIAASDAVCVYYLGKRHAGNDHEAAVNLLLSVKSDNDDFKSNGKRLGRIISIKNMAEYEERLVFKAEAENALKNCERFLEFIKKQLP